MTDNGHCLLPHFKKDSGFITVNCCSEENRQIKMPGGRLISIAAAGVASEDMLKIKWMDQKC